MDKQKRRRTKDKRDKRFEENLALAREGDEAAIHILWTEFGFDYAKNGGAHE
jgi:hypothetical protein